MVTITTTNTEFEVATGDNVDATFNTSLFDIPVDSYSNLTITSEDDDDQPNLFEVGETYTLSYTTPSGTNSVIETTVLRSDSLGGEQGAVVFEGTDPIVGEIHVMWTPNFNVNAWIANSIASGRTPGFYRVDQQSTQTYGHVCFTADTPIATPQGLRRVDAFRSGDEVITADSGAQRVIWTGQRTVLGVGASAPVWFAPGTLGNTQPLLVSQLHRVLLSGPEVELLFGTNEVLAPAKALVNERTVRLAPQPEVTFVHLLLETHEILFAAGAPAESLFLGDVAANTIDSGAMGEIGRLVPRPESNPVAKVSGMRAARMMLRFSEARALAQQIGLVDAAPNSGTQTSLPLSA
ncbi:Hint domain-containing protein [Tropicimonas marinistellae]|uniref:Hint domain-containing protein n=1 Tax=Tropicimonas marinistellae TaxID=1739787 RepID=UPI00082B0DD0|nr:Hint domain-containing protein [Tropicimonas marinistellae]